jgi:hypothetical protein
MKKDVRINQFNKLVLPIGDEPAGNITAAELYIGRGYNRCCDSVRCLVFVAFGPNVRSKSFHRLAPKAAVIRPDWCKSSDRTQTGPVGAFVSAAYFSIGTPPRENHTQVDEVILTFYRADPWHEGNDLLR